MSVAFRFGIGTPRTPPRLSTDEVALDSFKNIIRERDPSSGPRTANEAWGVLRDLLRRGRGGVASECVAWLETENHGADLSGLARALRIRMRAYNDDA